jgi:ribosomal protein S18 acetylase RimI-like enzyme
MTSALPSTSPITIRAMTPDDHEAVLALMAATPGVTVREADGKEATARYLARNPGLSWVAEREGTLVGCLMAGHDGRRGYLQHLVVHPKHRGQGLATLLVERVLAALANEGITKSHVDVLVNNAEGAAFWAALGWHRRDDIQRYSFVLSGGTNA